MQHMKSFQVDQDEVKWAGFLIDADSEACLPLLDHAILAQSHNDPDIVEEAWNAARTIVTSNRRDFVTHIRRFQSRENNKECRDLWGVLVLHNLQLVRERKLPSIRKGLRVLPNQEALRWPAVGFFNLHIRLAADRDPDIRRFERCSYCEREITPREPWNSWFRSLPLVGSPNQSET